MTRLEVFFHGFGDHLPFFLHTPTHNGKRGDGASEDGDEAVVVVAVEEGGVLLLPPRTLVPPSPPPIVGMDVNEAFRCRVRLFVALLLCKEETNGP